MCLFAYFLAICISTAPHKREFAPQLQLSAVAMALSGGGGTGATTPGNAAATLSAAAQEAARARRRQSDIIPRVRPPQLQTIRDHSTFQTTDCIMAPTLAAAAANTAASAATATLNVSILQQQPPPPPPAAPPLFHYAVGWVNTSEGIT